MKTINKIIVIGFLNLGIAFELVLKLLNIVKMKAAYKTVIGINIIVLVAITTFACSAKKDVYTSVNDTTQEFKIEKSDAQLWGETCNRCHLAPSPADYNDTDWSTISLHMRVRANLAANEIQKIEGFLKSAN